MKYNLILFFLSLSFYSLFAQHKDEIIISENGDTIKYKTISNHQNGKIAHIQYLSQHKELKSLSKEEMFMRGIYFNKGKHFTRVDKIETYLYNQNWELEEIKTSKDDEDIPFINLNKSDLIIENKFLHLEGQSNETIEFNLELKNNTTQHRILKIKNLNKDLIVPQEIKLTPLENKTILINHKIQKGFKNFNIEILEKGVLKNDISIEIIGYDLIDSDFKAEQQLERIIPLKGKEIFIQIDGNEKLLKIHSQEKTYNVPIGTKVKTIDTSTLAKGFYLIEVIDLKDNSSKYCKIQLL